MSESMIGRTITSYEPASHEHPGRWFLRLDDGTSVEFLVTDYGDTVEVTHLTDEVIRQRAIDAEMERAAREEETRRRREANARRQAHIKEMRGQLDPEAFEKWRRETYPTMAETLKDVWTSPRLQKQFGL